MPREYSQKAAVVTGGAQGIGRATAALLAERGYRVAIADRDAAAGRKTGMTFIRCDVSREPSVRACVRRGPKRFGRPGPPGNNPRLASPRGGPAEKLRLTPWDRRPGRKRTRASLASN